MQEKIVVGLFLKDTFVDHTYITPEKPQEVNRFLKSVYARVRIYGDRVGTRFIPDVNPATNTMYKAFDVTGGKLTPIYSAEVHKKMLTLTSS